MSDQEKFQEALERGPEISEGYQERVVFEKIQLDSNIVALSKFLFSDNNISSEDRYFMMDQLQAMIKYSECLYLRIINFRR